MKIIFYIFIYYYLLLYLFYFNQGKPCSKKLSKYVAALDYIDKILIVLSAATGRVSICSFMSVVGAPVGIASASFTLTTGIVKKY